MTKRNSNKIPFSKHIYIGGKCRKNNVKGKSLLLNLNNIPPKKKKKSKSKYVVDNNLSHKTSIETQSPYKMFNLSVATRLLTEPAKVSLFM